MYSYLYFVIKSTMYCQCCVDFQQNQVTNYNKKHRPS